ncbi:MAG TPA: acyl-CoA dehydrogenase family protein [Caulobacter sp.]|nr:acyl-CoA dehydrogenase family protein [Caulobacter sp.]
MADFRFSEIDQQILDKVVEVGNSTQGFTRYYEDHEHETPPDRLEGERGFEEVFPLFGQRRPDDTPMMTFMMAVSIARGSARGVVRGLGLAMPMGRASGLGNAALQSAGTPEQKAKWGDLFLAMSITEPNVGSDTKAIQATAHLDGDEWVLNGDKIFVTDGVKCDGAIVWATIEKTAGRAGIKSFLVLKGTPGFDLVRQERKLGIRASDTAAYAFRDCRIPRDALLGGDETVPKEGGSAGYKGVMKTFNMTRPAVASGGVAKARGALEFAKEALAKEGVEVDWSRSFNQRSAVEQKLIEMEADTEAAALTVLHAAWLSDKRRPNNLESSVCKAKGGEVCRTIPQGAMEVLGGMSVSHDHLIEKYLRDGRITDIYEGTGQIQRLIIAREILGYSSEELT